jgi:hypothetical protein
MEAKPSAPATAVLAAIFFSFIVNSSISWLPYRCPERRLAAHWRNGKVLTTIS